MIKNKMAKTLAVACVFSSLFTIKASAVTPIENLNSLDYTQQKTLLTSKLDESKKNLDTITFKLDKTTKKIEDVTNQIQNNQRQFEAKKMMHQYGKNNELNNKLKMFDLVLSSDSISDFFENVNLATSVFVQENKELSSLKDKENLLKEQHSDLVNSKNKLEEEKNKEEKDFNELNKLKTELDKNMNRKGDKIVFNPDNVLEKSNVSVDDMYKILKGTGLYELAPVYVEAENTYGINALFLCALSAHEGSWGNSNRAVNDNNLTGFGVYSDSSVGINANSKRGNLLVTAQALSKNYLNPNGIYFYNGYGIANINHYYCVQPDGHTPNLEWTTDITKIGQDLLAKI